MKNYIQGRYFEVYYDAVKIPLRRLREVIWEAWEAVPNSYIDTLYESWYDRCIAVIEAKGGPTKY